MKATHIVMVGTSIIRNAARYTKDPHLEQCATAKPGTPEDDSCSPTRNPKLLDILAETLSLDPAAASAELNAMKPWIEAVATLGEPILSKVILISTDTGVGRLAAEALRRHLEGVAGSVQVRVIQGLGIEERFVESLRSLHTTITETVRKEKKGGRCVASNLTGGFKPESGVALMATISGGGDIAYYIHESFRRTVVIPLAPYVNKRYVESLLDRIEQAREGGILKHPDDTIACLAWLLQPLGLARLEDGIVRLNHALVELLRGLVPTFNP